MIEKFDSYERAALFVAEKRAEGYSAEIVNESVGFLWGSRTVGGFRVQVSDEPGDFAEREEIQDAVSTVIIRYAVLGFLAIGVLVAAISVVNSLGATLELAVGICSVVAISIGFGYLIFRRGLSSRKP
jgi:hypothetical protein